MRVELLSAVGLGILLPVAEVLRRRSDVSDLPAYIDDFLMGALFLSAAWCALRGKSIGSSMLIVAWSIFCGAIYYSFFGQISNPQPRDISGLPNAAVVAIKGRGLLLGLVCLVLAVRRAAGAAGPHAARSPLGDN